MVKFGSYLLHHVGLFWGMAEKLTIIIENLSFEVSLKLSHRLIHAAKIPDEKTKIQRQINTTDKQIDDLVYQLYDLTPEEIAIVQGSDK